MWEVIIILAIDFVILLLVHFQFEKMKKLATDGKKKSKEYGKNLVVGIVSGLVVLILDKGVHSILFPEVDMSSLWSIISNLLTVVLPILILEVGILFLLIFYIINLGLNSMVKKR